MKKRCIAVLLALAMTGTLFGCGSSNTQKSDTTKKTERVRYLKFLIRPKRRKNFKKVLTM